VYEDGDVGEEYVAPQMSKSPIEAQLDMDDVLWRIYLQLKGELAIGGNRFKVGKPLLSDYGIQLVMKTLYSYLHKGVILSNLDTEDIRRISFWAGYDLATALMENYEKAGSPPPSVVDMIVNMVFDNIYTTLMRAYKGKTADSIREIVKIEKVRIEEKERKPGFFPIGGGD